jgi:integrase/recombinase XerC/integrase/recombinase XerD
MARASARDTAIIELFLQTGIRLSELVGLTIRDVTLEISPASDEPNSSSIRIRRGGGHATIPINHNARNALRRWLEIREPIPDTALFLTAVKKANGEASRAVDGRETSEGG